MKMKEKQLFLDEFEAVNFEDAMEDFREK